MPTDAVLRPPPHLQVIIILRLLWVVVAAAPFVATNFVGGNV